MVGTECQDDVNKTVGGRTVSQSGAGKTQAAHLCDKQKGSLDSAFLSWQ